MTVCVAAVCTTKEGHRMVVGASDRMITAGFTETEPKRSKQWRLSNSMVALIAGDTDFQIELLSPVQRTVEERIGANRNTWLLVEDVASLYRAEYQKARQRRIEDSLLIPLGLDFHSFIANQRKMEPVLVNDLARRMREFELRERSETIFLGVDPTGARLFLWSNGELLDRSATGYASIGSGFWHADSEILAAGHVPNDGPEETIVRVHSAKKRAEAAPGVGSNTDLFTIGPALGTFSNLETWEEERRAVTALDRRYTRRVRQERRAAQAAADSFREYVAKLASRSTAAQEASRWEPGEPEPPSEPTPAVPAS